MTEWGCELKIVGLPIPQPFYCSISLPGLASKVGSLHASSYPMSLEIHRAISWLSSVGFCHKHSFSPPLEALYQEQPGIRFFLFLCIGVLGKIFALDVVRCIVLDLESGNYSFPPSSGNRSVGCREQPPRPPSCHQLSAYLAL